MREHPHDLEPHEERIYGIANRVSERIITLRSRPTHSAFTPVSPECDICFDQEGSYACIRAAHKKPICKCPLGCGCGQHGGAIG